MCARTCGLVPLSVSLLPSSELHTQSDVCNWLTAQQFTNTDSRGMQVSTHLCHEALGSLNQIPATILSALSCHVLLGFPWVSLHTQNTFYTRITKWCMPIQSLCKWGELRKNLVIYPVQKTVPRKSYENGSQVYQTWCPWASVLVGLSVCPQRVYLVVVGRFVIFWPKIWNRTGEKKHFGKSFSYSNKSKDVRLSSHICKLD